MSVYDENALRKDININFKANGFIPRKDVQDRCVEYMKSCSKEKCAKVLDKMVATLREQKISSSLLTVKTIENVISQIHREAALLRLDLLYVYNAFYGKKYVLDKDCRKVVEENARLEVAPNVDIATTSFRNRFNMVLQRSQRCKNLDKIRMQFYSIDSLAGLGAKIAKIIVIGMLVQQKDDCYHLEDLTGSIRIEFTDTEFRPGIYFEGGIYMFEGKLDNNILLVTNAALVPLESASETREYFGNGNWFGGPNPVACRENVHLAKLMESKPDASIVILSDVFLDDASVLNAVYHLLSGFTSAPPEAFIFIGNFCSKSRQAETMYLLENGFKSLGSMMNRPDFLEAFKETAFLFIPGPDDPFFTIPLPRISLPSILVKAMNTANKIWFTTNPVRIQYGTKEIVIIRDDLVEKMCKHAVNHVQRQNIPTFFARTILSQAHLSPFCMHVSPVIWSWDHFLALHPLPDLLVVADKFGKFDERQADTLVANPGSFSKSSFGFHVYYPYQDRIESSQVPAQN